MRPRKTKDIEKALLKKGFDKISSKKKDHHEYYYLSVDGKKSHIFTYLSHGATEYSKSLMSMIKNQLHFTDSNDAENFFDCPLTKEGYVEILKRSGVIQQSTQVNVGIEVKSKQNRKA